MATDQIMNGPSKWDLMLSLFHGNANRRESVSFVIGHQSSGLYVPIGECIEKGRVTVQIDSLQREDGSGETWNFTGYEIVTEWKTHFSQAYGPGPTTGGPRLGRPAKGFFSTRTRTGTIEFD